MINRVIIEGRLTRDVELKKTTTGVSVCGFDIACTRNRRNADGEFDSDFFHCKVFNKLAEITADYGRKGGRIVVDGRLQVRKYEGRDGTQKSATEIIVDNISLLPSKPSETAQKTAYQSEQTLPKVNIQPVAEGSQELTYDGIYDGIIEEDMPW